MCHRIPQNLGCRWELPELPAAPAVPVSPWGWVEVSRALSRGENPGWNSFPHKPTGTGRFIDLLPLSIYCLSRSDQSQPGTAAVPRVSPEGVEAPCSEIPQHPGRVPWSPMPRMAPRSPQSDTQVSRHNPQGKATPGILKGADSRSFLEPRALCK